MVTDGVQDSRMPDGRLGERRLVELVRSCSGMTAAEIAACIEEAVAQAPVEGPGDDVAVLVVRAAPGTTGTGRQRGRTGRAFVTSDAIRRPGRVH